MDSWKKIMPDYEWKLWNTENFNIDSSIPYVKEAFVSRKWAFVADYIRLYALYTEGGIYLDSDVKVFKRFDDFLNCNFFTSLEYHPFQIKEEGTLSKIDAEGKRLTDEYLAGIQLQAAVMGAEKGCAFLKEVMDWYRDKHFLDNALGTRIIAPQIYARIAEKYGFLYRDIDQSLVGNMKVFRSEIFAGNRREITANSYAVHYCENTWRSRNFLEKYVHYIKFLWFLITNKIKK